MKKRKFLIPFIGLALLLTGCKTKPSEELPPVSSETPTTSITTEEPSVPSEDSSEEPITEESETPPSSEEEESSEPILTRDFVVKGVVTDLDDNPIENAIVQLGDDNLQADFTAADGSFEFSPEEFVLEDETGVDLIVSHPEHAGKRVVIDVSEATDDEITLDVKLEKVTFFDVGPAFGGKFGLNATVEVAYTDEAIVMRNEAHGSSEWSDALKIEMFIDTLDGGAVRDDSTYRVDAWGKLEYTDDIAFQFGTDVASPAVGITKYFDDKTFVTTIPYSLLGRGLEEVTYPEKGETIGFSIGVWNDAADDWDGWGWWSSPATEAQIAYNGEYGNTFIAPEHPERYVRVTAEGDITFFLKSGDLWVYVPPLESNLEDLDLTELTYHSLVAPFGGLKIPGGVIPHVSRSSDIALAIKFAFTEEAGELDPYTIEFFLDTGSATAERGDGTTYRFNVMGTGNPANIVSFGGEAFGNEETKTTVDGSNLYFAVTYEALGISNTDQYGVTFGGLKEGWDGWPIDGVEHDLGAAYFAEYNTGFVAPEFPSRYIRILSNGAATFTTAEGKLVSLDALDEEGYRVLESNFGGKFFEGGIATKVRHGETGIEFVFTAPKDLTDVMKIELFIDKGLPNAGQDVSTRRLDLWSSGTEEIEGVEYEVEGAVMKVNVLYEGLGISATDQIGFSIGVWNDDAKDWDGWGYADAPFAEEYNTEYGATFIAPENAFRYVRLLSDDSLTFTKANLEFYV